MIAPPEPPPQGTPPNLGLSKPPKPPPPPIIPFELPGGMLPRPEPPPAPKPPVYPLLGCSKPEEQPPTPNCVSGQNDVNCRNVGTCSTTLGSGQHRPFGQTPACPNEED